MYICIYVDIYTCACMYVWTYKCCMWCTLEKFQSVISFGGKIKMQWAKKKKNEIQINANDGYYCAMARPENNVYYFERKKKKNEISCV